MFSLRKPSPTRVTEFLESQSSLPFSYQKIGATASTPPSGYLHDEYRVILGAGESDYLKAVAAIQSWRHFDLPWVELAVSGKPRVDQVVGIVLRLGPVWSLNACRVVYTFDNDEPEARRSGFAYGTLPGHAESGEERFEVLWTAGDDAVCYRIFAFSRPANRLIRLGSPLVRTLQRRFATDSQRAMQRALSCHG